MDLFMKNQRSKDREKQLLERFMNCISDIEDYLDEYDEFYGLAFNEDKPIESTENLRRFIAGRYYELIKD